MLSPRLFIALPGAGTNLVYSDSEAGLTSFTLTGHIQGKRRHGKCVVARGSLRHAKRCTITKTVETFTHLDTAGLNIVAFSGRANGKALPAGRYTITATPTLGALAGPAATVSFAISK
jgi:hypothetical protein